MAGESKLEEDLREYANTQNVLYWKFKVVNVTGVPDRMLSNQWGDIAFMELKNPKASDPNSQLSPQQIRRIVNMRDRNMRVEVVSSYVLGAALIDELARKPHHQTTRHKNKGNDLSAAWPAPPSVVQKGGR